MRELLSTAFIIYSLIALLIWLMYHDYKRLHKKKYIVITLCENDLYYSYVVTDNETHSGVKDLIVNTIVFNNRIDAYKKVERLNNAYKFNDQFLFLSEV